ncbi:MAG: fibronectin type III domain-containing protein, partial [Planctomycetaceae bacterium]|nr:fibronectin type III domain-containing protein [Planctomycetaceae bacterium]
TVDIGAYEYQPSAPLTPANFVATAVSTKTVLLTWDAVANAESYNVYRYDSTVAGGWRLLANVAGTSWTQGGYTPGATYAFRVSAVNTAGESALSPTVKATMVVPAPLTPANVTAAAVSTKTVLLTWDAVANAESYNVYRYDSTVAGGWKLAANVAGTSWTQSGYTPGGTYAFRVSAVNTAGESALSPTVKATMVMPALPPATPANFVAGAVNTKTVLLTWDAVAWAESYNVYCYDSTVAGGWRLLANVAGTSWTQGGYTPGGTYAFRVSAVNTYGVSPLSETKKATMVMPALPPATPANVAAAPVAGKPTSVQLTWDAVATAESYNVYRYDSTVVGGWRLLANVAGTSWTQSGYTPGGTYAFRVSAVNPYGVSPLSETKKATMIAPPLPLAAPMTQALLSYLDEEFLI